MIFISSFTHCYSSTHYKPIGNNSNGIANRPPPPHPSASGIPPVPPNVAPPKTSSSSDSTGCPTGSVRNKNNNGLANIGQIEADELEHIYESLDLKKLISTSKLPPYGPTSQNNVLIIYILPLLISFIFKVRCGIFPFQYKMAYFLA